MVLDKSFLPFSLRAAPKKSCSRGIPGGRLNGSFQVQNVPSNNNYNSGHIIELPRVNDLTGRPRSGVLGSFKGLSYSVVVSTDVFILYPN